MKMFMTALALASLVASSAYAHQATQATRQAPAASSAYAAYPHQGNATSGARVSADAVVSPDNRIIGQDPDANVRLQMLRGYESWNQ